MVGFIILFRMTFIHYSLENCLLEKIDHAVSWNVTMWNIIIWPHSIVLDQFAYCWNVFIWIYFLNAKHLRGLTPISFCIEYKLLWTLMILIALYSAGKQPSFTYTYAQNVWNYLSQYLFLSIVSCTIYLNVLAYGIVEYL